MLIQCPICEKVKRHGVWVELTEKNIRDSEGLPIQDSLCPACKAKEGGCPGLKDLRKRFTHIVFGDRAVGVLIVIVIIIACVSIISNYNTKKAFEKFKYEYSLKEKQ